MPLDICFVVPLFNEEKNILSTIQNLIHLPIAQKQIIIVNDGSNDKSMHILQKTFNLIKIPQFFEEEIPTQKIRSVYQSSFYPELIILDKEHGKKSDALNAGINACTAHYFFGIDADTVIDHQILEKEILPILASRRMIAMGGTVSINNDCTCEGHQISTHTFPKTFLSGAQSLEYLRAFITRQGWDFLGQNFIISGAFCIFPKELIIQAGGFFPSSGEDMEMTMRLHHTMKRSNTPYEMLHFPHPIAWTKAPSSWVALGKQRIRWHLGLLESLFFHKSMLKNSLSLFTYPFWLFGEALEPVFECAAFFSLSLGLFLGILTKNFFLFFFLVTFGCTLFFTIVCFAIEFFSFRRYHSLKTIFSLFVCSLIENIGYRQFCIVCRLIAIFRFVKNFAKIKEAAGHLTKLRLRNLLKYSRVPSAAHNFSNQ